MKTKAMCSMVLGCAAFVAVPQVMLAQAQGGAMTADPQSAAMSGPTSGAMQGGAKHGPDAMFLHKAAEGGMLEIQAGQLAAQKSTNPAIQSYGQQMVTDHTKLNDSMKPIADSMGLTPPSHLNSVDQAKYDKLAALSGTEFDHAYLKAMVMDHRMDLREFNHEENTTQNSQLKDAVAQGIPVIKQHLQMVTDLAKQNGVDVPMRGGPGGPGGNSGMQAPSAPPSAQ